MSRNEKFVRYLAFCETSIIQQNMRKQLQGFISMSYVYLNESWFWSHYKSFENMCLHEMISFILDSIDLIFQFHSTIFSGFFRSSHNFLLPSQCENAKRFHQKIPPCSLLSRHSWQSIIIRPKFIIISNFHFFSASFQKIRRPFSSLWPLFPADEQTATELLPK